MKSEWDWLFSADQHDPERYRIAAENLVRRGDLHLAATAYDLAYGLAPEDDAIRQARRTVLDKLSVVERGVSFRYIPAGRFLMGSDTRDPDEQPVHPVQLDAFWLSETPLSWEDYRVLFAAESVQKMRKQLTLRGNNQVSFSIDWESSSRENPASYQYRNRPMVAVSWAAITQLCDHLSNEHVQYRVPTEAEWEKAARGGLVGQQYPWGDELPNEKNCDCERFHQFSILPMRSFPPNGYGLYAMCGGVWEWTADRYDAHYYAESPLLNPTGPATTGARVWRGGSWADSGQAATVSFRMSERSYAARTPNVGFRLCRTALAKN
jgi:formylglycine-generating enzyme